MDDLYNNDVDLSFDDTEAYSSEGDSTVSDDSNQQTIHEWVVGTSGAIGTPGEDAPIITPPSAPEPMVNVEVPVKFRYVINRYDAEYLEELANDGAVFYVIYDDGSEEICDYTEVVNPYVATNQVTASEVYAITQANNQHFWYDDNGAHVTEETRDSWEENAAYNFSDQSDTSDHNNILMNSYGLVIRKAFNNIAAFSKSAVSFYDGDGNDYINILASFGKSGARIGSITSSKLNLTQQGIVGLSVQDIQYLDIGMREQTHDVTYESDNYSWINDGTNEYDISSMYNIGWPPPSDVSSFYVHIYLSKLNADGITYSSYYIDVPLTIGTSTTLDIKYDNVVYGILTYTGANTVLIRSYGRVNDGSIEHFDVYYTRSEYTPSFILGDGTVSGPFSYSIGEKNNCVGSNTAALGSNNDINGNLSIGIGHTNRINNSSIGSFLIGCNNDLDGNDSIFVGSRNSATGFANGVMIFGDNNFINPITPSGVGASGDRYVYIFGDNNMIAGSHSIIIGSNISDYKGLYSYAFGHRLEITKNQVVFGQFNRYASDDYFILGYGTESEHFNIFTIDKTGNHNLMIKDVDYRYTPSNDVIKGYRFRDTNECYLGSIDYRMNTNNIRAIDIKVIPANALSDSPNDDGVGYGGLTLETTLNGTSDKRLTFNVSNGSLSIPGTLYLNKTYIDGLQALEFYPPANNSNWGGFIDFHYNQSTADYTTRIWENASGRLTITGADAIWKEGATVGLSVKSSNVNQASPSGNKWTCPTTLYDSAGNLIGHDEYYQNSAGTLQHNFAAVRQKVNGSWGWYQCGMAVTTSGTITYAIPSAANFRSAISAQVSGDYAPHGWTQKASANDGNTLTYSLSGCTEVMFAALSGTSYLGSVVLPVGLLHASTQREVYLTGARVGANNGRGFALKATTTKAVRATATADNSAVSCTWWVFAR